jgi:hypothetical protein
LYSGLSVLLVIEWKEVGMKKFLALIVPGWWGLTVWPEGLPAGTHWEVSIRGMAEGSYSLNSDYYEDAGSNDILSITVIPEPMTLSLLALGVLTLLRKRRP